MISKRNKRGIVVLIFVSIVIIYLPRIFFSFSDKTSDKVIFKKTELNPLYKQELNKKNSIAKSSVSLKNRFKIPTSKFNPNEYTQVEWQSLGLSNKQAQSIVKYLKYPIYSNEELKKIYVLPKELYDLIKDSAVYTNQPKVYSKEDKTQLVLTKARFNINTISKEQLIAIKGIGNYTADKILNFRNALGGYYNESQYQSIWKIDSIRIVILKANVFIDTNSIEKLNLNNVDYFQLVKHPYIKSNVANSIIKLRTQNGGAFHKVEDILRSKIIDQDLYKKLKPYLSIEK